MSVLLVKSNSCLCSSSETIKKSLFSFLNKNQRTFRWGLKDTHTKYSFGGLCLMFTWHEPVPGGSCSYSLSDTSVVLCYKRNPLCPQLISARAIILLWRLHETGSGTEVHGLWVWSSIENYSRLSSCLPNNLHAKRFFSPTSKDFLDISSHIHRDSFFQLVSELPLQSTMNIIIFSRWWL